MIIFYCLNSCTKLVAYHSNNKKRQRQRHHHNHLPTPRTIGKAEYYENVKIEKSYKEEEKKEGKERKSSLIATHFKDVVNTPIPSYSSSHRIQVPNNIKYYRY